MIPGRVDVKRAIIHIDYSHNQGVIVTSGGEKPDWIYSAQRWTYIRSVTPGHDEIWMLVSVYVCTQLDSQIDDMAHRPSLDYLPLGIEQG